MHPTDTICPALPSTRHYPDEAMPAPRSGGARGETGKPSLMPSPEPRQGPCLSPEDREELLMGLKQGTPRSALPSSEATGCCGKLGWGTSSG